MRRGGGPHAGDTGGSEPNSPQTITVEADGPPHFALREETQMAFKKFPEELLIYVVDLDDDGRAIFGATMNATDGPSFTTMCRPGLVARRNHPAQSGGLYPEQGLRLPHDSQTGIAVNRRGAAARKASALRKSSNAPGEGRRAPSEMEGTMMWDALCRRIAWILPRRLIYWCAIRLMAHGTQGQWSNQAVPELTAMDALKRW
jgi:hypothetical protein